MSPVGDGRLLEGQEADEGRGADGEEDLLLGAEGEDGGPAVAQGAAEGDELHQAEADHNLVQDLDNREFKEIVRHTEILRACTRRSKLFQVSSTLVNTKQIGKCKNRKISENLKQTNLK